MADEGRAEGVGEESEDKEGQGCRGEGVEGPCWDGHWAVGPLLVEFFRAKKREMWHDAMAASTTPMSSIRSPSLPLLLTYSLSTTRACEHQ